MTCIDPEAVCRADDTESRCSERKTRFWLKLKSGYIDPLGGSFGDRSGWPLGVKTDQCTTAIKTLRLGITVQVNFTRRKPSCPNTPENIAYTVYFNVRSLISLLSDLN